MSQPRLISDQLAGFVLDATLDRIPAEVQHWCKLLRLDAIGNAYASSRYEFCATCIGGIERHGRR